MNPSFPNIAITPIAPKDNIVAPNLPFTPEVVNYGYPSTGEIERPLSLIDELNAKANAIPIDKNVSPVYKTEGMDLSGRFPKVYLEGDNEEIYAQGQTTGEKAWNGVVKMSGLATSAFINGTAGIVYGTGEAIRTGKFSSFYDNDLSRSLNEWTESLENSYAHYKTLREREGHWWEPENLFTGNFLFDNIVKNLGFSIGSFAAGGAWGAALKAVGLTSRLVASGAETAAKAEQIIGQAATLPEAERIAYTVGKLEQLYNTVERGRKIERGIVATTGSFGEGGLEALNNSQQFRDNMIENYKRTYGYAPSTQELKEIDTYAQNVGNWSLALNVALLSATQYVQLPKILNSSYKSEKGIINDVIFKEGKYVSNLPEAGAGKFLYKLGKGSELLFNPEESFEEGMQFAIQVGTQNYFDKKFNDEDPSVLEDGILKGFKETLTSDEGLLNVVTGGLSGGLMTSGIMTAGQKVGPFSGGLIAQRGLLGYGGESKIKREEIINEFNKTLLTNKLKDGFNNTKAAEKIQEERIAAIRQGDVLESKDLEFDYAHTYIETRLKYGAKESIDFEINDLRKQAITEDGFLKLQQEGRTAKDDTRETFLARLDNLQEHVNNTASIYNGLNTSLSGIALRNKEGAVVLDKDGKPVRKYSDKSIQMLTYAASKVKDYDKRLQQLSSELLSTGVSTSALIAAAGNTEEFVKILKEQQALLSSTDELNQEENLQKLNDVAEIALRRKNFINEYKDIQTNPQKWDTTQPLKQTSEKAEEKVKIKIGDNELEVGNTYFIGTTVDFEKQGFATAVPDHQFTVLGENEDGTIKVQTVEGKIKDIERNLLEKYNASPLEELKANKTANYFYTHRNDIFTFNFGKDFGGKKEGRLQYEKGKLYFVYRNAKGEIAKKQLFNEFFIKREGFKEARITKTGEVETKEQRIAREEFTAAEEVKKQKETLARNRQLRVDIITQLEKEHRQSLESISKEIESETIKLANIQSDLNKLKRLKEGQEVKGKFVTILSKNVTIVDKLKNTKKATINNLATLNKQKGDLEMDISYFQDFSQNLDELPENSGEFLKELNEQQEWIEDLHKQTSKSISELNELLSRTTDAIKASLKLLKSTLQKQPTELPIDIKDTISRILSGEDIIDIIPELKEQVVDVILISDLQKEIIADQELVQDTIERIKYLQEWIDEISGELRAKTIVLERFTEIVKKYQEQKEEEERLTKNKALQNELLGTKNIREQVTFDEGASKFELNKKKSIWNILHGTITSSSFKEEHHVRANRFGFRLRLMPSDEQKKIKTVALTQKTEAQLGLKGLTQFLKNEGAGGVEIDPATTIVGVITKNGKLVDEFGETFELTDDASNIRKAIFQVYPLEKLTANYPKTDDKTGKKELVEETMFRDSVSEEERKFYEAEYANWRKSTLAKTTIDENDYEDVNVSFGTPEYIKIRVEKNIAGKPIIEEKVDYTTKTPVEDAGLIENIRDFGNKQLLTIPTTNDEVSEGTITIKNALGKVFFKLTDVGLERLNNRKLNKKEAQVIFDVVMQFCKNLQALQTLKTKEEKDPLTLQNKQFTTWLDSILYWGLPINSQTKQPKTPGFNSMWFEKDTDGIVKLFISGTGTRFLFTPSSLEANKTMIITLLEGMYHDVNADMVNQKWNVKYDQIVGIKHGVIEKRTWHNYQSYLLALENTNENEKRNSDEIPLSTILRPLADKEDTNRKGIYFIRKPKESKVYKAPIQTSVQETSTSSQKVSDIQFPTMEQIINAPNEIENKNKRKELKDRWEKLKKLIECI